MRAVPWLGLIILPFCVVLGDVTFDVPVSNLEYTITQERGFDRIAVPGSFCVDAPGSP